MRHLEKHSYFHKHFKKETDLGLLDFSENSQYVDFQIFLFPSLHTTLWILYDFFCCCWCFSFVVLVKSILFWDLFSRTFFESCMIIVFLRLLSLWDSLLPWYSLVSFPKANWHLSFLLLKNKNLTYSHFLVLY